VSLTPNAKRKFQTTSKSEHHWRNGLAMQKNEKMHACPKLGNLKPDYLREFEPELKKASARVSGAQGGLF
jgi:hypothetical protein